MAYSGREATPGTLSAFLSLFMIFIACLSVPIIKSVQFVKIDGNNNSTDFVLVGLWGFCAQGNNGRNYACSSSAIGFLFNETAVLTKDGVNITGATAKISSHASGYSSLVHLPAIIMAILTTAIGACGHFREKRNGGYLRIAFRTAIAATVAVLFAVVTDYLTYRNVVQNVTEHFGNQFTAKYSNGLYMMIASVVFMVIAIIAFYVGNRVNAHVRQHKVDLSHNKEMSGEAYAERRREEEYKAKLASAGKRVEEYAVYEETVEVKNEPSWKQNSRFGQGYSSYSQSSPSIPSETHPLMPVQTQKMGNHANVDRYQTPPLPQSTNTSPITPNGYPQQLTQPQPGLNQPSYPPLSRTPSPVRQPSPARQPSPSSSGSSYPPSPSSHYPPSPSSTSFYNPSGLYPSSANAYQPPAERDYYPSSTTGYPVGKPHYLQPQQGYQDHLRGRSEAIAAWH